MSNKSRGVRVNSRGRMVCRLFVKVAHNGWVFVSGFALHNAQFKGQMLMAKLAQIPCYA